MLPPVMAVKNMADRMKAINGQLVVKANMSGDFVMLVENDMVKLETFYDELENPAIDPSQVEPSQQPSLNRDPKDFAQVRVDIKDFIKFCTCHQLNPMHTICCIIENHGLVFYVYIGENGGENMSSAQECGTITYCNEPRMLSTESAGTELPFFEFTMDHSALLDGSAKVIAWAFPDWNMAQVKLVQQTHGITNRRFDFFDANFVAYFTVVKCTYKSETILIRTYGKGTDAIIDRSQEMTNMIVLSRAGLSPKLHARFSNGLVYGYILPKQFAKPDVNDSFHSFMTVDRLKKELISLKAELDPVNAPIVFSHCDLLTGNIIYNSELDKVDFIDYEYGSYNPRGFDIGNHFCEHAGFDCEWDLYPKEEFQHKWLREYLVEANGNDSSAVSEDDVSKLYSEVNKYALAAHLYWGIWALCQAELSDLEFDYVGYSKLRIDEYFRRKKEFLAL
ncbi:hypothetical protein HK100_000406 [Physocladia obscura]|uniref:ethanolamine kinase n=1 Tax=Physocladia obscura TaxID=109957 RepID=A0AAD5T8U1_9FUNG|nr:hypothetical protein HK100_000406 [Physocladia obscura]